MNRREVIGALLAAPAAANAADTAGPSPLSARGEANLAAFARLVAYVRFFHPSDAAAAADWNAFVVSNVETVEGARSPADLVARLDTMFRPIAPTMTLHARKTPPAPAALPAGAGQLVMWTHRGVGVPAPPSARPNIYASKRVPVPDGQPKVLSLSLGEGVSATMPTTAYSEQTPPEGPLLQMPAATPSAEDRRIRLANIILAWGVLQHFYPYFDVVPVDWDAELTKGLRASAQDADAAAFSKTLAHMIAALRDGHGEVSEAKPRWYLPVSWAWIEDRLVVTAAPATAQDLPVGGVITRIDGVEVTPLIAALEKQVSAATPHSRRARTLFRLRARLDKEPATLEGQAADGATFKVLLAPTDWPTASAVNARAVHANFSEPSPGVVYVDLSRVTEQDVREKLPLLAQAKGVVFDDRGYPSGSARRLLAHFSDRPLHSARFEVPLITAPDRQDITFDGGGGWTLPPQTPRLTGRLVLLTGGEAISYAESWAGVFEGERIGPIVGGPTAGTNGNINWIPLPGRYGVTFTGMRVRKHDGSPHHGVGILPTFPVAQTIAGVRAGRDEVLERGVALAAGEA
jgi:hypothetical protein